MAAPMKTVFSILNRGLIYNRARCGKILFRGPQYGAARCFSDDKDEPELDLAKPGRYKQERENDNEHKQTPPKFADVNKDLDPELVSAAENVAQSFKGDQEQVATDLTKELRQNKQLADSQHKRIRWKKPYEDDYPEKMEHTKKGPPSTGRTEVGIAARILRQNNELPENENLGNQDKRERKWTASARMDGDGNRWSDRQSNFKFSERNRSDQDRNTGQQNSKSRWSTAFDNQGSDRFTKKSRFDQDNKARKIPEFQQGVGLGIFTTPASVDNTELTVPKTPTLFDILEEEDQRQLSLLPPSNAFDEEIQWTKEGKMWKFPVDNEEGMEEEANVGFHEHVFLDHLLEGFPKKGPVRVFMELVITGLSKNPYLTVEQKKEHVNWFKEYFADKYHLIDEVIQIKEQSTQV